ncbi:transposase [Streptomyces malaysiense]|uniref:transposase n=1 Tax=Streptomyces malaysiense TaxID=1428626 RepID=UPI0030B81E9C
MSHWPRPDPPTSGDRLFCHVYGRVERSSDQLVPGRPYSFVAALESGRTSWALSWTPSAWARPTTRPPPPPPDLAMSSSGRRARAAGDRVIRTS